MITVVLFLPVIHAGYESFLRSWAERGASELLILGRSITDAYPELRKDIRALEPRRAVAYLNAVADLPLARVIEADGLRSSLPSAAASLLVFPDEEISRRTVENFGLASIAEVQYDATFLRWDRKWSQQGRQPGFDGCASSGDTETALGLLALSVGHRSSDWWRQVGAVAVLDGELVGEAHNEHLPHPYSPYMNGDPRNAFSRGVRTELSTALHAEASLISKCARIGQRLGGADLFVSTFPCPSCARLVAQAGFRRCFYSGGYSMLEGEEVLRAAGVELIYIDTGGLSPEEAARLLPAGTTRGADALRTLEAEVRRRRGGMEER